MSCVNYDIADLFISIEMNSANIKMIDCYTNYSYISEVFEYSVQNHALNKITRAQ